MAKVLRHTEHYVKVELTKSSPTEETIYVVLLSNSDKVVFEDIYGNTQPTVAQIGEAYEYLNKNFPNGFKKPHSL